MGLLSLLTGSTVEAAGKGAGEVLNGVGDAAIKIRTALTGDLPPDKKAEIELAIMGLENQILLAQNDLNKLDAQSGSLYKGGWRPLAGWSCASGFLYTAMIQPLFVWVSKNMGWQEPPSIDSELLIYVLFALLGVGGLRSLDKRNGVTK
ncbi:MAG: hypothetical protein C4542_07375 [Dehalococcoidia bacterium]|nr:MAG: hypothetical protein C4542_07375 [Dehalococcoidia bacterium]